MDYPFKMKVKMSENNLNNGVLRRKHKESPCPTLHIFDNFVALSELFEIFRPLPS